MTWPSPALPFEIVDLIVQLALLDCQGPSRPDWERNMLKPISAMTLASKAFRQICLRRFLQDLRWSGDGLSLIKLLDKLSTSTFEEMGYRCVRILRTNSRTLSFSHLRLRSFTRLHALSIDMGSEGLSTQHPLLKAVCKILKFFDAAQLTALKLCFLPRIDPALLHLLASSAPGLIDLHLSCTERIHYDCCWSCCVDTADCTIHSPIPDMYSVSTNLAIDFSQALKPISKLTRLHLGIFLTNEQNFYDHMHHDPYEVAYPVDECDICMNDHDHFDSVVANELEATLIMAKELKSLRRVSWSSWFGDRVSCDWNGEVERTADVLMGAPTAVIWILRRAGRIRVKRGEPW